MENNFKVLLWVESRRGLGHFRVAASLVRSLEALGCSVYVTTSTPELFSFFYNDGKQVLSDKTLKESVRELPPTSLDGERDFVALIERIVPDAVIIEMWPMRRAVYDGAIVNALNALKKLKPSALVYSLIRDVYGAPNENTRHKEGVALIESCVDIVLVRGDGQIKVKETWIGFQMVSKKVIYVGYFGIKKDKERSHFHENNDWLVGMGGGWFDDAKQISASIQNLHKGFASSNSICRYHIPNSVINELEITNENAQIVGIDSNYIDHLTAARLAILQAGYNSVLEALNYQIPAVFMPARNEFTSGEQIYRLKRFEELGIIGGQTPWQQSNINSSSNLRTSIEAALAGNMTSPRLTFGGEQKAAEIILNYMKNGSE